MSANPLLSDADLLARLIAFDSTSRFSNLPIADFIADYLDRPGIRIERNPSEDGDKVNLIVTVGPETDESRDGLMLSGHMDVVPAEEPEWQSDPFEMKRQDDRYVGRGTCDMKGFVALAINAAARADAQKLKAPLALILTFDEELGTLGAHHFMETWSHSAKPLPRRGIIGEPTSLQVVRMHKGHAKATLTVKGRPAHSGYPHLGHNAIEVTSRAISALSRLRAQLESETGEHSPFFPEVPFVALNLATIHGGSAINIVPDSCVLELGYRILPGMQAKDFETRIREALEHALAGEDWSLEPLNHSPPMLLADDHDLYQTVCALNRQDETVSASYATDAGWLQESGFECLLYGPGNIGVAHKPNEWLPIDEFERCSKDLDTLVQHYCVEPCISSPSGGD